MKDLVIKKALLDKCIKQVDDRLIKIKQTIATIEESLFEESKSSSGDKHETGRAMLQIDRENAGNQLREIEILAILLSKIDVHTTSDYARLGSLVQTDRYTYFVSISIGSVEVQGKNYLCVALNSPVGQLLSGKRKGDGFFLNGQSHAITSVH